MQRKYAILIDAGFIKRKIGSLDTPLTAEKVVEFTERIKARVELKGLILHRIFYYDAEPLTVRKPKPLTGGKNKWEIYDFSSTPIYQTNLQLLEDLKREPFFAVRLGEVHFRGWSVKQHKLNPKETNTSIQLDSNDLVPNVQQKGVDMRIGLDISSLSLKDQVDVIVLVTGDSDFIPALKFARREGKQVILVTLGQGIRPEIYAHTDLCIEDPDHEL